MNKTERVAAAKVWRCGGGHVLGVVVRNGCGVQQLSLYRQAVDAGSAEPGEVEVMAVVEGLVLDVRCSVCGRVRTWAPGEEAIRRLVERYREL